MVSKMAIAALLAFMQEADKGATWPRQKEPIIIAKIMLTISPPFISLTCTK
jgi:hypothetical protein